MCHDLDAFIVTTNAETKHMHSLMTDVLMAQDFQDLTGQVIRKVIDLVREVEDSLINMLTAFGISQGDTPDGSSKTKSAPKSG